MFSHVNFILHHFPIYKQLQTVQMSDRSKKMIKMKMGNKLFQVTQRHHKKCLQEVFLRHYEPLFKGFKPNLHWTTHVSMEVLSDLRLHLSWVFGGDVTHWTDGQIGVKIVKMYQQSGLLPMLTNEIRKHKHVLSKFGETVL